MNAASKKRRTFIRPPGERRYRKIFLIAAEGIKTEPQYFDMFNNDKSVIHIKCLVKKNDNSPAQVLKRMKDYINSNALKKDDEAWLVVDKDKWTDEQLTKLCQWAEQKQNYGFALSNPKFEYWLLLHFEDGKNIASSRECSNRLKKYLPEYDKDINPRKIRAKIKDAIRRAKMKDTPPCKLWPKRNGSTVYRLVEKLNK